MNNDDDSSMVNGHTDRFAVRESDAACFNGAAATAVSYYRRAIAAAASTDFVSDSQGRRSRDEKEISAGGASGWEEEGGEIRTGRRGSGSRIEGRGAHDFSETPLTTPPSLFLAASRSSSAARAAAIQRAQLGVARMMVEARAHPGASTQWTYASQTPRVFHPQLFGQPWWNPADFALTADLKEMYRKYGPELQSQLDAVVALREGELRGATLVGGEEKKGGGVKPAVGTGLQRVFTPVSMLAESEKLKFISCLVDL